MNHKTRNKLQLLSLYLQNLPKTIPYADPSILQYGFDFFALDDKKIKDYSPISTLNCELEVPMSQHNKGSISFKECGPSLNAMTNVLGGYLDQYHESPEMVLLMKWVDNLTIVAAVAFKSAGIPLPFESHMTAAKPAVTIAKKYHKPKESVVHQPLSNSIDPWYIDLPEVADFRTSGAKIHLLLLKGTRCYYKIQEAEVWKDGVSTAPAKVQVQVRCIGSKKCGTTWNVPHSHDQIMGHLIKCSHIDEKFQDHATEFLAGVAKGPRLSILDVEQSM
ncbi:hypothetical protein DFH29DRAFT_1004741 [Suillus ampliporus]|nr:hypothetical protein DFH29DRAFT_1004741 [Suillus ampliporus]